MMWWAVFVALAVALAAPRFLPRVALQERTRVMRAFPLAAVLGAATGLLELPPAPTAGLAVVAGLAAVMVVVDLYEHRLPDSLTVAGVAAWLLCALIQAASTGEWSALLRAALAAFAVFAGFFVLALLAGGMLGFGDVKLSALLGAVLGWFGWVVVGAALVVGIVLHGLAALVVLAITRDRKADVPMGPALIAGAAVALFLIAQA